MYRDRSWIHTSGGSPGTQSVYHPLTKNTLPVFLNEIVAQLWPNINKAGSKMLKDIADPMLKATLPGPLSSLHFTKVDFGEVPMRFSNAVTTKTDSDGIKVDMNVDWDGKCDIELDGAMVPALVSGS